MSEEDYEWKRTDKTNAHKMVEAAMIGGLPHIMLYGESGVGKTAMLAQSCANLGLTMKYFNCATMDPFLHLVGVPDVTMDTSRNQKVLDLCDWLTYWMPTSFSWMS